MRREGQNIQGGPNAKETHGESFSRIPEVKMAASLRELVENAVKQGITIYPETADLMHVVIPEKDLLNLGQQLGHLGFTPAQSRQALTFLTRPSSFASSLLENLNTLEACIEFLVLSIPECDLPQRFLPSINSSNPFITSAHSGADDIKTRWIEDKAVKEAGWPAHAVRSLISNPRLLERWDLLIAALGNKLIGDQLSGASQFPADGAHEHFHIDIDEVGALGARFVDATELVMPLFSASIQIHILVSKNEGYPRYGYAPMYITSTTAPAYIRLHLLSKILVAIKSAEFIEPGEGFCMAVMRVLEGEWAKIEDNGPPDMSSVLRHLIPAPAKAPLAPAPPTLDAPTMGPSTNRKRREKVPLRTNDQIKRDFEKLCLSEKYAKIFSERQKLPAFTAKEDFLKNLEAHKVVVVVGETGCGKTTQLPQFILDSLILSGRGSEVSILVTQPRRISAISVAARVSSERLDDGSVGYAIRGESKRGQETKLLFCTTGVVLRRLGSGDTLQDISHIVVDEVHERSVDGDFLLLELKELLKRHHRLKVVLMSATINHETFVNYFNGAPLLTIPGFTHPVADRYLEDLIPLIHYRPPLPRSNKKQAEDSQRALREELQTKGLDDSSIIAIHNIIHSDRIDFQLVAAVVHHIVTTPSNKRGGILIFLPGVQEIRQCIEATRSAVAGNPIDILPLHANLSNDEQRRVFLKTENWKIIAATNVAETSITIDDVIYVIDLGKVKETQYDPDTSLTRLVETWITRAAARQRRGRAGRTQPGICYKIYTQKQELEMTKFPVPEILRVPLENISLTVKAMREEEDVKLFLSRAINPPQIVAMERAWSVLEEIGAVDEGGRLTPLGRHISMLPVDLRLAKMLILGTIFQCLDPALTIAASLSSKPLFLNPLDKRDEAMKAKARFSVAGSDLLTDLRAYDDCARLHSQGKSHGEIRRFCEDNFISPTTMREITTLRLEFLSSLADIGFIPSSSVPSTPSLNTNSKNTNLLKAIILGGLWPRVARVHLPQSAIKFDKVQAGTVQRENTAREFKIYDLREGRVFLHPGSVLFGETAWKAPFLVYFHKYMSSKVFLRDATEVPLYALLLFGGTVSVNHIANSVTVGSRDNWVKLKAWPRIGILVNHLRRLLDAQLERCVEEGTIVSSTTDNPVLGAMLALLTYDGLTA
ncbi:P-loop containing nucleoside triphosphate hydrolase protein [Collybia nuda]|uniref:RNA helicase n=1 Tax=Collybia nuda TaxID=64659 RepID=A0A9P6CRN3_9AGAR|nr:P-loop containing nucleoside triphosphate hydrolase protein [Collybia nuda]